MSGPPNPRRKLPTLHLMKAHFISPLAALLWPLLAGTALAKDATDDVYAVVEIGASGVKGMVVQALPANADPENPPTKMLKQYEPLDKNAFTAEAATRVAAAVTQ